MDVVVVIIGAGQSGLAVAACLNKHNIANLILERDDCIASLWRKRSYDRLHLHIAKQYCQLPYDPHPSTTPTFIPKAQFVAYLDDYASKFDIRINLCRNVESAVFGKSEERWRITARNLSTGEAEVYMARFLVVASGENDGIVMPELEGMESFGGVVLHSSQYRSGEGYQGKRVLVVGSGNSGMEIAYDLASCGARTSIVVRSPLHLVTKEILLLGMCLINYLPCRLVDSFVLFLCYLCFGPTSMYGLQRPTNGPFYLKINTPTYPVIDVGTFKKIKTGEIQVLPAISRINYDTVAFVNGKLCMFDAIILATGYKSTTKEWLMSDDFLIGDDGMTKKKFPNHWKGKNGLYCAGLARKGIYGSADDALEIANDINVIMQSK